MELGVGIEHGNDITVQRVDEIKLLGIFYTNSIDQNSRTNWDPIVKQTEAKVNRIFYKQSSIFGRAMLVNTFIEPKLIYPATSLDPPLEIINSFKKNIRAFIFKGTIPRIRHDTLILSKMDGGINLHDVMSKIISFRLKFLYKVINNPNEFPIACYFLSGTLNNIFTALSKLTRELPLSFMI